MRIDGQFIQQKRFNIILFSGFFQNTKCDAVDSKFGGNEFHIVSDVTEKECLVSDRCILGFASRMHLMNGGS